jgi:signal transduction histidine kinase
MDPQTAIVLATLMILANSCVLGLVRRRLLDSVRPAADAWQTGLLCLAAGCLTLLAHAHLPTVVLLMASNALLMSGLACYWRALRRLYGRPPNDKALLLAVGIATLGILVFSAWQPNPKARIFIATLTWIYILVGSCVTLKRHGREDATAARLVLMALSAMVAAFCILRAIYFGLSVLAPTFDVTDDTNFMNRLTPLVTVLLPVIGSSVFMLMCHERGRQLAAAAAGAAGKHEAETLSYIGHDLRAPLASIVGYTRLLRQTGTPEQAEHLRAIERSASYQLTLIDEILEFATHELKPLDIQRTPVELAGLLEDVAQQAYILSLQQDNRFELLAETELPARVSTDTRRLQQVLLNLISNAAKFTHGGLIGLTVRAGRQTHDEAVLEFTVSDSGPGIDPQLQPSVFEAFVQAEARPGSAGLGLYIARSIVKNLGGDLRLESRPGAGSRFSFALPVKRLSRESLQPMALRQAPRPTPPEQEARAPATAGMPPLEVREDLARLARAGGLSDIEDWLQRHSAAESGHQHADYYEAVRAALQRLDFQRIESIALAGTN